MYPPPIFTLTMNPAVDVSSSVTTMEAYQKLRCRDVEHHAGGGGINVSRVIKRFNGETLAIFPRGGPLGAMLDRLLADEDVPRFPITIAGDTREDFSVSETATGKQFRFILPGPALCPAEVNACMRAVIEKIRPGSFLVASGSLPPGVPSDFYAQLAQVTANASAKFVLDSSGPPLRTALDRGGLFLIKPARSELAELAGVPLNDREACVKAAQDLVASGKVEFVCVSLGPEGAALVGREIALIARAPQTNIKTTIGAGDSLLAALVWAFARAAPPFEALKLAVAAGTASLLTPGTALCSIADIQRLKTQIEVEFLGHPS